MFIGFECAGVELDNGCGVSEIAGCLPAGVERYDGRGVSVGRVFSSPFLSSPSLGDDSGRLLLTTVLASDPCELNKREATGGCRETDAEIAAFCSTRT